MGSGSSAGNRPESTGIKRVGLNKVTMEVPPSSSRKVNYDLDIPKAEMEWLDRSAIGNLKVDCTMNQTAIFMASKGFHYQVSPIDSLSTLLTFRSKEVMIDTIEDVGVKGWFDVIKPWSMAPTIRELAVWVILEEVPLYIWHKIFFESLGNRWGSFVCLDECTANRSRFDIARMLVRVKSSLNIPSTVSVNVRGSEFRILVAVEESDSVDISPACSKELRSDEEDETLRYSVHEAINVRAAENLPGHPMSFQEQALVPRFLLEGEYSDIDYSSKLSENELSGGHLSLAVHVWNNTLVGQKCRTSKEYVGLAENGPITGYCDESSGMGLSNRVMDHGLIEEVSDKLGDISGRPVEIYPIIEEDEVSNSSLVNQREGGTCSMPKKVELSVGRRRKYKGLSELGYDDIEAGEDVSVSSLSDSDIEHRNSVILNEAIATLEVCEELGLSFDCDNDQLIEVFKNLDKGERMRKAPATNI